MYYFSCKIHLNSSTHLNKQHFQPSIVLLFGIIRLRLSLERIENRWYIKSVQLWHSVPTVQLSISNRSQVLLFAHKVLKISNVNPGRTIGGRQRALENIGPDKPKSWGREQWLARISGSWKHQHCSRRSCHQLVLLIQVKLEIVNYP